MEAQNGQDKVAFEGGVGCSEVVKMVRWCCVSESFCVVILLILVHVCKYGDNTHLVEDLSEWTATWWRVDECLCQEKRAGKKKRGGRIVHKSF